MLARCRALRRAFDENTWRRKWGGADPWDTLGVARDDDWGVVKKKYRELAKKHHPDGGGNVEKFKEIRNAYSALEERRKIVEMQTGDTTAPPEEDDPWKYEHDPRLQEAYIRQRQMKRELDEALQERLSMSYTARLRNMVFYLAVVTGGYFFIEPLWSRKWSAKYKNEQRLLQKNTEKNQFSGE